MYDIFQSFNCVVSFFIYFCFAVLEKTNLQFFRCWFFYFFNIAYFHVYFSRDLTFLWLNKTISKGNRSLTKKINIHPNIYYSYFPNFNSVIILFSYIFLIFIILILSTIFHGPVCSYSDSQTSSSIKLIRNSFPSVGEKKQKISVLCSPNSIHNEVSITNNNDIQYCETARKKLYHYDHFNS